MADGDPEGPERGGKAEPGRPEGERAGSAPVLTERQRRQAREARRAGRKGARQRVRGGHPLVQGVRATGRELARTFSFLGGLALAGLEALSPLASFASRVLRQVGEAVGLLSGIAGRAIAATGALLGRLVERADRLITPARAIVAVALGSALLLGWSQFIDYRAVEIGQPGYAEVLDVATPPRTDGRTPIDEHSFLLVATALVALVGTVLAASGRRPAGLVVTGAGLLSLSVALLSDLPAGTDASEVAAVYSGAEPVLLAGFWLELAAGLGLAFCGALMTATRRPARRLPSRQRRSRPVTAGGTG